jgi:hypothetical protein
VKLAVALSGLPSTKYIPKTQTGLRCVVSHPFDREKWKGWGTEPFGCDAGKGLDAQELDARGSLTPGNPAKLVDD